VKYTNAERKKVVKSVIAQIEEGIDVNQACKNARISRRSLYTWAKRPEFDGIIERINDAIRTTHEANVEVAERTLFQRAVGYMYDEEHFKSVEDKRSGKREMVLDKRVRKARPGDVTALIFLLCNLAREGLTTVAWQSVFDIKIEKDKLDTLDDLIQKHFAENDKQAKTQGKGKAASGVDSPESSGIPGESEKERELRESISLEMSDEPGMVG